VESVPDTLVLLGRDANEHDIKMHKLAVSSSLARSAALKVEEAEIDRTLEELKTIPVQLARTGQAHFNTEHVLKSVGTFMLVRGNVNLHSDMLDFPKFAWNDKTLETLFEGMQKELDVESRLELLNDRLNYSNEITQFFVSQHVAQHSSKLEKIIIALIVIEVFFNWKNDPHISFMRIGELWNYFFGGGSSSA
jgi:uncharacterized Rmd1/YagE family protein